MPFDQRSLINREAWFPGGPRIPKNRIFFEKNRKNHPKRCFSDALKTKFKQPVGGNLITVTALERKKL